MCTFNTTIDAQERPTHPFDREWLQKTAQTLANAEYVSQKIESNSPLRELKYDDYKKIQFRRSATIWSKEQRNFRLSPLHPGFLFDIPVKLNLVVGGVSRRILYTTEIFKYDEEQEAAKRTQAAGYSGFSVTSPINKTSKWDEFLVFQGGTYFRAVGKNNWYGLSARGLAVNTAKPVGEEFPVFTEFWIERPSDKSKSLVVHALMDSPSVTGAYTFKVTPGENTEVEVKSTLYPRTELQSFGIAPLTSMFLFNPINSVQFDDFRPAVHDSDGLFMITSSGEKIWRPLANPRRLQASVFRDNSPKGFGLLQRATKFEQFEDIEANYEARPSAWVEPIGDWGEGHVELIEIPTKAEIHDNIVAFWQPKTSLKPQQAYEYHYKILWGANIPSEEQAGLIVATSSGMALGMENVRDFVIDFKAKDFPEDIKVNASTSSGKIVGVIKKVILKKGRLRVVVKFEPDDEDLAELRVSLSLDNKAWGETWLYKWTR